MSSIEAGLLPVGRPLGPSWKTRIQELLNQDTFFWGTLKGVGKIYVQVLVDAFCSIALAKVYISKMPITADSLLYDRVLPFYNALGVELGAVLTDNGRERSAAARTPTAASCCWPWRASSTAPHAFGSPRTNGFVERMNRTLLDECFRVKGRTERYLTPAEIQRDLDAYLDEYNLRRTHQGYRLQGRTLAQALRVALAIENLPPFVLPEEEPIDSETTAA